MQVPWTRTHRGCDLIASRECVLSKAPGTSDDSECHTLCRCYQNVESICFPGRRKARMHSSRPEMQSVQKVKASWRGQSQSLVIYLAGFETSSYVGPAGLEVLYVANFEL